MLSLLQYGGGGDTLVNLPGVRRLVLAGEHSQLAAGQPGELRHRPGGSHQVRPDTRLHGQQTEWDGLSQVEHGLPPEHPDLGLLSQRLQEGRIHGKKVRVCRHDDVIVINLTINIFHWNITNPRLTS